MKHKHAELIKAWADGAEIQYKLCGKWNDTLKPEWFEEYEYRIKPPEVAQWRKDMAQALKDGKVVEHLDVNGWGISSITLEEMLDPTCDWFGCIEENYRTRPEPKPDVVRYAKITSSERFRVHQIGSDNLKLIWDGETGALKDAEVLK